MTSIKKKLSGILIAGTVVMSLPLTAGAASDIGQLHKDSLKHKVDYVALGDSLAAGRTPYDLFDKGYPDYIVQSLEQANHKVFYDNFGASGYTTENVKNDVLTNDEMRKEIKKADVITLDIGANDLVKKLYTDPSHITDALVSVNSNLKIILETINDLNPKAKVYVMGYYNPFPHYPAEQQAPLLVLLDNLNKTIQGLAAANGDIYVPTADIIKTNEKEYVPNPKDIHLTLDAYQLVANEFMKSINLNQK
ncbi:GDSL-type esterase/lipase family protein [Priestia aryabhattai]|uniref:GDSL-type esterase/lipase family protein n=1 Tax=Priestia aryabhattai TaxID=412384 RepID=A0AAX6NDZ3_PRIAR|nr:GDSL-type esterase/lipase family protein [Priestia aryabhattai]MDU9694118.1 GDSL-type esterase/lipase family protein [Priestia aryabhattai]